MALEGVQGAEPADTAAPRASGRRVGFAILVLVALCALCAPLFVDLVARDAPHARAGVVSYAGWGPLTRPVALSGEWNVEWRTAPAPGARFSLHVPGPWTDKTLGGKALPDTAAASYFLTLRDLPAGRYTLFVPKIYGGSRVVLNGRVLSEWGTPGLTPQTTRYVVRAHTVPFETDGTDVNLRIDISTFHHRDNGLATTPVLGLTQVMTGWDTFEWLRSLLLVTSLLLLTCYAAVVFVFRVEDRASLYFGLACLFLLPLVAIFSHDNLMMIAMPWLSFRLMLGIEYVTIALAQGFILAYAASLFPRETPRQVYWLLQGLIGLLFIVYVVYAALGDTLTLSSFGRWAFTLRVATLLFMLAVVVFACVRKRDGAAVFLVGIGVFVASLVYLDVVTNSNLPVPTNVDLLPLGTLMLLFSHVVIMVERWNRAIDTSEQTNADLRELLDVNISISSEMQLKPLLGKIVEVASKVIHADRSSLFLHDDKTDELWSVVAEGVSEDQIRIPSTSGLAGWSFTEGLPLRLDDAYEDERFNRDVDAQTGYKTQSALSAPVIARDGRKLGVMQALNRQGGPGFSRDDVERMNAFAAQAAIAIDNATLFSEVASERNYNESILASMSSGVLTLDRDVRLAKVNPAAARILEVQPEQLADADARAWLGVTNPGMLADIDETIATGRPRTLLDIDVRTAGGNVVSANVSMVPLVSEGAPVGLLVLIEDITEGKRVQGAMRRFMTPKVVEQVMARNDDLLFGTACRASVLFADIRNFTAMAEALQPRETVDVLNGVFTELFEAVAANDGVLDKFQGDAIMAVYGAPISSGQDPQNAVASAVAMTRMVQSLKDPAGKPIGLGVSIATGEVIAGTIGSPKRMDYTVIGDCVNLAARLQQVSKLYRVGVVICEATAAAVGDTVALRELDIIRVRGRQQSSRIFQVLTDPPSPAFGPYRRGREAMVGRYWRMAIAEFEAAVAADPADRPSALMLARARALSSKPPADDWDGVWDPGEPA